MSIITRLANALTITLAICTGAHAQEALVIDGETISPAATLAAAKTEGHLVHYGAFPADNIRPIHEAFTADTGVRVDYIRLSSAPLFQRIVSEHQAGALAADFIDLTDMLLIADLVKRGILNVPHKVPSFDAIDATLKEPEGRWYTYINSTTVIAVNTAVIPEADWPTGYKDVLDPKYDGQLGITILDGGSVLAQYGLMRDLSPTYWADLKARNPRLYEGVSPLTTDLARGDLGVAVGPIGELVLAQMRAGAPVRIIFAKEGVPSFGITGGVAAGAKNPNAATLFLDWVTSKRGGDAIAKAYAYGANPASAVPAAEGVEFPSRAALIVYGAADWQSKFRPYRDEFLALFGK